MTFQLILRHQANKNLHTLFSTDNVCTNYLEIEESNLKRDCLFFMWLLNYYFYSKTICSEKCLSGFFGQIFENYQWKNSFFGKFLETKKLTSSYVFFKDFYHKFVHKFYIAVIFKNSYFHMLWMAVCFCYKPKIKLRRETTNNKKQLSNNKNSH